MSEQGALTLDDLVAQVRRGIGRLSSDDQRIGRQAIDEIAKRFATLEAENAALREQLAQWCADNGWATGHGDTAADILREIKWQYAEEAAELRERVAGLEKEKHRVILEVEELALCGVITRSRAREIHGMTISEQRKWLAENRERLPTYPKAPGIEPSGSAAMDADEGGESDG